LARNSQNVPSRYSILLYAVATKERTKVETGMKELTFLSWAKSGPLLAVGTAKGNLLLYNEKLGKRVSRELRALRLSAPV
jgi:hypothetical protein